MVHLLLVQCDVAEIPRLGYLRAQNVRLLQSARDIRRAKEVQEMLEAGMPRIQGAVDSLKGDYGFIKYAAAGCCMLVGARLTDLCDALGAFCWICQLCRPKRQSVFPC